MQNINILVPVRKANRISTLNYRESGSYFLTSCAYENEILFGRIMEGSITLSPTGIMITKWWENLPGKFRHIELGNFVVMPNHFHGILRISKREDTLGEKREDTLGEKREDTLGEKREDTLGEKREDTLVLPYETSLAGGKMVDTQVDPSNGNKTKLWQRSYWDHIIRTDADFNRISEYIKNNPSRWIADRFHRS